jgi:hypothetical protein
LAESDVAFHDFDASKPEDEPTDDRLASQQICRIVQVLQCESRVFEPKQDLRPQCRGGYRCSHDSPANRGRKGVAESTTKVQKHCDGNHVGKRFERGMRVEAFIANGQVVGKDAGGIGCNEDAPL